MRTRHLIAGVLALVLAGCTAGAAATPVAEPSQPNAAQPTTVTTPTPTEAPTEAPEAKLALDVKVTFDGETCTYVGPTTIVDGTLLRFEYAPDQAVSAAYLLVYAVDEGTTFEDWLQWQGDHPDDTVTSQIPPWVIQSTAAYTKGAGTMLYMIEAMKPDADGEYQAVGGYQVQCNTPKVFPATQLVVAGS